MRKSEAAKNHARSYSRAYHAAHRDDPKFRERARQRAKEWYYANRDRALATVHRYVEANRDKVLDGKRKYHARRYRTDPEYRAQLAQAVNRRRARKAAAGPTHTLAEWREKCALFANLCAYCGEAKPLTRDHKIPLSRGGTDDITNILPACRSCNCKKRTRTADEFLAMVS